MPRRQGPCILLPVYVNLMPKLVGAKIVAEGGRRGAGQGDCLLGVVFS